MRKSFRFRRKFRRGPEPPRYRINALITAPEVRLVDENDENVGVVTTADALARAQSLGLDLIEVSPKAEPPVAKILNYGSFKYQEEKQKAKQKAKQKKIETKGIRLTLQIGAHDRTMRIEQSRAFMGEGNKVRVEMLLRGRQRAQKDLARSQLEAFVADLGEGVAVESPIDMQGGKMSIIVAKKT